MLFSDTWSGQLVSYGQTQPKRNYVTLLGNQSKGESPYLTVHRLFLLSDMRLRLTRDWRLMQYVII